MVRVEKVLRECWSAENKGISLFGILENWRVQECWGGITGYVVGINH